MRALLVLSLVLLTGCKESSQSAARVAEPEIQCPVVDPLASDIYESPTSEALVDGSGALIGNCIAIQGDYAWIEDLEDASYHYAINLIDGSIREGSSLVFSDAGCTMAIGQEFEYPLHLSGDVYLFSFEGILYEYPIGIDPVWVAAGNYFVKVPGGSCDPYVAVDDTVRVVQPSGFARIFSGPVGL